MCIKSRCRRAFFILRLAIPTDGDEYRLAPFLRSKTTRKLVAIHHGHADIDQAHRWPFTLYKI